MAPGKVIYTDGRDVVVTDSTFRVKNISYNLNGVTKLSFWTIRPDRWPGFFLVLLGLTAAATGYFNFVPAEMKLETDFGIVSGNILAVWLGVGVIFIGLLNMLFAKERYAVRIGTAEGEKNALVSRKREYIAHIVDAVHSAFDLGASAPTMMAAKK